LLKRLDCKVPTAIKIIETCVILHNICESNQQLFIDNWDDDDDTRAVNSVQQPDMRPNNAASSNAKEKREQIARALFNQDASF